MSSFKEIRRILASVDVDHCNDLIWFDKSEVGWYPVRDEEDYDDEYFDKYKSYRDTEMGKKINDFRVGLVEKFHHGDLVDVGIGSGHFIDQRGHGRTTGYDVSGFGMKWLDGNELWSNPYSDSPYAISCWDSLEHIRDCMRLINQVKRWVFISIPIFDGVKSIRDSRHFKPHEHWWYFTNYSIMAMFGELGFVMRDRSEFEVECGREGVVTYAFERVDAV
tara:strand:+ start:1673 stop:2332 length:660 start_codon:yes stop_codon:yes gene_type:complete